MGDEFAARVNALRPSPEVMERLRAKVEVGLLGAYEIGAKQALDTCERSTKQDDGTSDDDGDAIRKV